MLIITQTALELGFLYALIAMALFLSYRILDIADLTTDGCFVLGAAVSVTVTAAGHPILAIFAAMLAGACAGFVTAFLQTKLGVPSILAGIITNTGLYTVNLMAMGWKSNQSLLGGRTVFTMLRDRGIGGDWYELLLAASVTILAGLLLVLFLQAILGTASVLSLSLVIGVTGWCAMAKVVRTEVRQLRQSGYVIACRCMGGGFGRVLWRHLAPNFLSSILFMVVMSVSTAIAAESTLSFLGMGLPLEVISWGSMLTLSQQALNRGAWWIIVIPGVFLVTVLVCVTAIGGWLRRAFDRRQSNL